MQLQLKNPIQIDRKSELVEIPKARWSKLQNAFFYIKDKTSQVEVPYQKLANGNLLVQIDLKSKQSKKIQFFEGLSKDIEPKVYGRFVEERYGDFAFENDVVAFRMYGKPLESIPSQNAWGVDVWSKRTDKMIINKWYKLGNYHKDNGDGLDFFRVGKSLGSGDALPFIDNEFSYLGNFSEYKILENGPLRFTFQLVYPDVTRNQFTIRTTKTISLDAGSQLYQMTLKYSFEGAESLPVFVGIVHWDEKGKISIDNSLKHATYWPVPSSNGFIGTGLVLTSGEVLKNEKQHLGTIVHLKNNQEYTFYAGAAWDKANRIPNDKTWNDYVSGFASKLKKPIRITN